MSPDSVAGSHGGVGYEYPHVAIDDHSRIAFSAILPDQTHHSALCFFLMASALLRGLRRR